MNNSIKTALEKYISEEYQPVSLTHGNDHLIRTAKGSKWFASLFTDDHVKLDLAYIAGLIHDLGRPKTEKIDHTPISHRYALDLLTRFEVLGAERDMILSLIDSHREIGETSLFNQSVFLADKLFEQSGAFLPFRRFIYIGECDDLKNMNFEVASMEYWGYRLAKFSPDKFDKKFHRLAKYQYGWLYSVSEKFNQGDQAIVHLGNLFYNYGRRGVGKIEKLIRSYKPEDDFTDKLHIEAIKYLDGKKYDDFREMIDL